MIVYEVIDAKAHTPALVTPCLYYAIEQCFSGDMLAGYRWQTRQWPDLQPAPAATEGGPAAVAKPG